MPVRFAPAGTTSDGLDPERNDEIRCAGDRLNPDRAKAKTTLARAGWIPDNA
jgi:hypothetical protein